MQANRRVLVTNGLLDVEWDYGETSYPNSTTEIYTFKSGGEFGTTVRVITIVYTDATKENISKFSRAI